MDAFKICGGTRLNGIVSISGAKNAAVAIIPASLLTSGVCRIENIPNINDVNYIIDILEKLGSKITRINEHTVEIDNADIHSCRADYDILERMRASYYLLGSLLGRFKKAVVSMPRCV